MSDGGGVDGVVLLADALGLPASDLTPIGREPLGAGTVAGFELAGEAAYAYVDTSLIPVPAETGLVLDGVARVWMHPADPHLPALAPAAFGQAAAVLVDRLGDAAVGMPEVVAYRPGRRAVLRIPTSGGGFAWIKVVRPRRVERIVRAHAVLADAGLPVPAVRGWSPDGLLVIDSARGVPATDIAWDAAALLDSVDVLRQRLAAAPLDVAARTSLLARRDWYVERLAASLPDEIERVARITRLVHVDEGESTHTIHGDLHFGQLFLDPSYPAVSEVTGLIDVDTAGQGDPADDAAAFIGHAVASVSLSPAGPARTRVVELARSSFERWGDQPGVRSLTAVHLLGHALGAADARDGFDVSNARARALLDSAEALVRAAKNPLIAAFEAA